MGKLYDLVKQRSTLFNAWRHIRSNGVTSKSEDTRNAISQFDQDPVRNIASLQSKISSDTFAFDHQIGVLKSKAGRGKRGIVLASVRNRIVERAILDVLQERCPEIQAVNSCPTSIGGVPNRSVPHGLKLIVDGFEAGHTFFARSDISSFFDNVPRDRVIEFLRRHIDDAKFIDLFSRATTVSLENEKSLGEDRRLFPCDNTGVAQGSPLSPLCGNIILSEFDGQINSDDIVCVRFVDDFVILGRSERAVSDAFQQAEQQLAALGLQCKNPFKEKFDPAKADRGAVGDGIVFLGHHVQPGLMQPSRAARDELMAKIRAHLAEGRASLKAVKNAADSFAARGRFTQTLDIIDRVITGWAEAFSYCNSRNTFEDLDRKIDEELSHFRNFYRDLCIGLDWKGKRRLMGVRLVGDVRLSSFQELPELIKINSKYMRSDAVIVSSDGSVFRGRNGSGKELGPGGWAFVTHGSDVAGAGHESATTNNRMELLAVIKALEAHPIGPVRIRTDSKYVVDTANGKQTFKKNHELWKRFQELCKGRRVKVDWVKGHSGDPYNDQADQMANAQAKLAAQNSR